MVVPRILLAIFFLIRHAGAWPMALPQGCGPSTLTCCLRRGAPNLRCEGQSAYDYEHHTGNFDPYNVFGATIRNIDYPVVTNAGPETRSLGLLRFTLYPDTNQFRMYFVQDLYGPAQAVSDRHRIDSRVAGVRVRWGLFRAQAGVDEDNPRNRFIVGPVRRGTLQRTDIGFAETQLYGHITHTNNPNVFFNSADVPRRNIHYRMYFRADWTDLDGNVVTGEPPPHHNPRR